ncbi:MAG: DNA-3-methyladenine glycosylase 2 family protein [Synergistaceae bacterium]|nr:DNA-3-methyladenine glycosylase 2 family protein [Synergistaceae bacterium]
MKYFEYTDIETDYLKSKDKKLAEVIDRAGHLLLPVDDDVFSSVVRNITAQMVSGSAFQTVWTRITDSLGEVTPDSVLEAGAERLQSFGMSFRKAEYIADFARKVHDGEFTPESIKTMNDDEAMRALTSIRGIGEWTAEMILLFTLQRKNIFSFKDLGIIKGLCAVYHHKEITKERFMRYRIRFSPYGSIASFYLWEAANDSR